MDHPPRLVLDEARPGTRLALDPEDIQHLVKALRLSSGAALEVLDGHGHAYSGILALERRGATVVVGSLLRQAPEPGTLGSVLPRVEAWAPFPKGTRAADAVGRLAQLGVAAWQGLITVHTEAEARHDGEGRRGKLAKVAREALKQCGGLHALEIRPAIDLADALRDGAATSTAETEPKLQIRTESHLKGATDNQSAVQPIYNIVLAPDAPQWLSTLLQGLPRSRLENGPEACLRLWAGPEAGFSAAETVALRARGFAFARISPQVLRIETALEAAAAIVLEHGASQASR